MPTSLSLPLPDLANAFMLRGGIAFLNHGSFGACPRPVFETYQAIQREIEAQPVEFLSRRASGLLAEARASLERYLGARPGTLVFAANVTHALNIVARSLDLRPGDEVLSTGHEYGAIERTWQFNCEKRGARYVPRPLPLPATSQEELVEQVWQGVTARTRVIAISHISSPTAVALPVAAICRRAREAGILTVVDGAHAPGQVALDLEALGADFYGGNCHKWLCAPKGAGFLYARPERQALLEPLVVSWGWRARNPSGSEYIDMFDWLGTDDPSAYLTVPTAIKFQEDNNWPAVRLACHNLLLEASARICELTGLAPLTPDSTDWWMQMRSLPLPPCDPKAVQRRLWDEFRVEVPCHEWGEHRLIRISVQAYNTPEDIDRLVEGLKAVLF
ncbi:MAG TPA: aminotransferase class V-fold PLP-dependent enzyme [Roseiflexaceae bacterium]|nr:aminotransferase class V-fold PLP-dependent enzyme [Roseiflexaceae bacterium]